MNQTAEAPDGAVAAEVDIDNLIGRLNSLETAVSEAVEEDEEEDGLSAAEVTELRESADDAPVIKLVYSILGQAVTEGASDVHFETEEREMRVRFRVDGVLSEVARVPKRMVSTWGMARSPVRMPSRRAVESKSGSPPEMRTSRMRGVRRM